MLLIYIITIFSVAVSLIADRGKTIRAFQVAARKMLKIAPAFLTMTILVSIVLYLVPDKTISRYLGHENKVLGLLIAYALGSISLMPGFIAFPLCGMLLEKGVLYMVLSGFSTTLMMVGIMTFPVEKAYLGAKVAILRNLIYLVVAVVVTIVTGLCFGELFG
ncbi:MAG: hypothetical protein KAR47_19625 [Planctomycetes bacterium]|nr:hypothetical protein [Planctomycetota bacterium]